LSLDIGINRSLRYDCENGKLALKDHSLEYPALIIPLDAYFAMVDEMFACFGSASSILLEKAGEAAGRTIAERNLTAEGVDYSVKVLMNKPSGLGHGRYELARFDPEKKNATVRVHNCLFARQSDKESRSMWYLRGLLKGYFAEIFDDDEVKCTEVRCSSLNYEYCEFEIFTQTLPAQLRSSL
jgi:predicted hydrocarbon binding protein